jgi:hypothetical protein
LTNQWSSFVIWRKGEARHNPWDSTQISMQIKIFDIYWQKLNWPLVLVDTKSDLRFDFHQIYNKCIWQVYIIMKIKFKFSIEMEDTCWFHLLQLLNATVLLKVMLFNSTFNNISVISWQSILLFEDTRVHGENHWPATSQWQSLSPNVVSSKPRPQWSSNSQHSWW